MGGSGWYVGSCVWWHNKQSEKLLLLLKFLVAYGRTHNDVDKCIKENEVIIMEVVVYDVSKSVDAQQFRLMTTFVYPATVDNSTLNTTKYDTSMGSPDRQDKQCLVDKQWKTRS